MAKNNKPKELQKTTEPQVNQEPQKQEVPQEPQVNPEPQEQEDASKPLGQPKSAAEQLVERSCKYYPGNKVYYVTSDMQLFLEGDYNMALLHQKTLTSGELITIKLD